MTLTPGQQTATDVAIQLGYLSPGETATGGLLTSRLNSLGDAAKARYNEAAAAAGMDQLGLYNVASAAPGQNQNAAAPFEGGVQSAFIEPFSPWQEQGLTQLAGGNTAGQGLYDQAAGYLQQVGGGINAPTTGDFNQWYGTFSNPYQQDVLDSTIGRITEQGDQARSRISAAQAKLGRTGDSATAIQLSELDKDISNQIAETSGNLNFAGFQNAAGMAQKQMNAQQQAQLQQMRNLLGASQQTAGLGNIAQKNYAGNIQGLLNAGGAVQQQGQNYLTAAQDEWMAQQGYPTQQVANLGNAFGAISPFTTGTAGTSPIQYGSGTQLANQLTVGGQLLSGLGNYGAYASGGSPYPYNPNATYTSGALPWGG